MKILFITMESPLDADRGARLRDRELIRRVAAHHDVALLPVLAQGQRLGDDPELTARCDVLGSVTVDQRLQAGLARLAKHVIRRRPLASLLYVNDGLLERVRAVTSDGEWDIVQVEHSLLAPCIDAIRGRSGSVLSLHNVGWNQYRSMADGTLGRCRRVALRLKAWLRGRLELAYIPRFDRVVVVSELERQLLLRRLPTVCPTVVRNGVDLRARHPLAEACSRNTLLFVGHLGYPPNADAVAGFCSLVLPVLRSRVADLELLIVGPEPPARVRRLADDAVRVIGRVEVLEPWYRRARAVIIPLHAGGGTRLKAIEAMAYGRCVVSTPVGVEGLAVRDGHEVVIAEPLAAFADRVADVLNDRGLRRAIAARGRRYVEREHSWDDSANSLLGLYEVLATSRLGATPQTG